MSFTRANPSTASQKFGARSAAGRAGITRGDALAMELLDLWAARARPGVDLGLVYPER
jgi:hypothetical protein